MFKLRLLFLTITIVSISFCSHHYEPWRRHQSVMHMSGTNRTYVTLLPNDLLTKTLDENGFNELRRNTNFSDILNPIDRTPLKIRNIVDSSYHEYEEYLKGIMHAAAIATQMKYMESKKEKLLKLLFSDCQHGLAKLKAMGLDK